jgi:hypothetical protein
MSRARPNKEYTHPLTKLSRDLDSDLKDDASVINNDTIRKAFAKFKPQEQATSINYVFWDKFYSQTQTIFLTFSFLA